ncbi:MAG: DNA polymerase III subunit beta [Aquificae bacterium]|nr:DNA polymerase III subunit beta [Aquificota bacterium]
MKLTCDREALEKALVKAKEATERKASLPILSNFLLEAEGDRLTVRATDLENYLTLELPAAVLEPGKVCVNSQKLTDIVKGGSCAEVILQLKGETLVVECGRSRYKLATVDPDEYPEFPSPTEGQKEGSLPGELLLEGIDRTDYAVPKDAENLVLNATFVRGKGDEVHFVGTDGHRLALYKPKVEGFDLEVLIPKRGTKVLKKLVSQLETVKVSRSESFAFLEGEGWKLAVRLLEGEYPDYEAVIPTETPYAALVPTEEFTKALKRVTLLVEGKVKPVKIALMENLMKLFVSDPEFGEAEDEVEVEFVGDPIEVEFNARYLLEALDHYDSERVWFKLVDADSPALIEAEDPEREPYLCLIMPMTL